MGIKRVSYLLYLVVFLICYRFSSPASQNTSVLSEDGGDVARGQVAPHRSWAGKYINPPVALW